MSTYIESLSCDVRIAPENMGLAASLLPECYRSASKTASEQVGEALEDCGFAMLSIGGGADWDAFNTVYCEFDEICGPIYDVFEAIAPAVEDGSLFTYIDHDDATPYGYFFHDGRYEFKIGAVAFD